MKLVNVQKKSIPFGQDNIVSFYKGVIQSHDHQEIFQYSISTQPHMGAYRLTLSFEHGEIRILSVFQLKNIDNRIQIQAENEAGNEIWENPNHIQHAKIKQSIDLIVQEHL